MEHNFWYWLIQGLSGLITTVAQRLPFHTTWAMQDYVYNLLSGVATPIIIYFGSFFNFCWFMISLGILVTLEAARLAMAAYRSVVKLLPLP